MGQVKIRWKRQARQMTFLRACGLSHPFDGGGPGKPCAMVIGYGGAAGGGKMLSLNTPLISPRGWITMGDVQLGDTLFDERGNLTIVTYVSPVNQIAEGYRMVFDDGSTVDACKDHLWLTYTAKELAQLTRCTEKFRAKRRAKRPSRANGRKSAAFRAMITERNRGFPPPVQRPPAGAIRTTAEIAATLTVRGGRSNHAIPVAEPLKLPYSNLPLDPYLLGIWLGDGNSRAGRITTTDPEIIQSFVDAGFEVAHLYGIEYSVHGLSTILRKLGVFGNKHVPMEYLRASEEQRLALLQGLMDTDGTALENGSAEFTSAKQCLAEAVVESACSLGHKARITEGRATLNGRDCGAKWRVHWTPPECVFRLPRKMQRAKPSVRRTTKFRYVVSCEPISPKAMRCIAVDSPSHLYLAGKSMIPTHNTDALLMAGIIGALTYPGIGVAYFRREFPQLEGIGGAILRSRKILTGWCKYDGEHHRWTFPNGSMLQFCHCKEESDVHNYQSQQFDILLIDEATQFTRFQYRYLTSRNRATKRNVIPFTGLASNPGNIGHTWFMEEFVNIGPPEVVKDVEVEPGKFESHVFIPAKLADNQVLEKRDPAYRKRLENLPENERRMLLGGDWDVFAGQYFPEWRRDIHVIKPFELPRWWRRFRSLDYGLDCTACYWWAVSDDGKEYVYRELYQPNLNLSAAAKKIVEMSPTEEKISYTVASPDLWNRRQDTGFSGVEIMNKAGLHGLTRADDRRVPGWRAMREHLQPFTDEQGVLSARLRVFENCTNLIRTLPALIHDEHDPEDVADKPHEITHGAESIRYGIMSRPPLSVSEEDMIKRQKKRKRDIRPVVSPITGY